MKVKTSKGFTLAEMLIVMAVVVVLAAAAVPTITNQVEAARESNDLDSIRAGYVECYTKAQMDASAGQVLSTTTGTGDDATTVQNKEYEATITALTQKVDEWQGVTPNVGGQLVSGTTNTGATKVKCKFSESNGGVTLVSIEVSTT